MNQPLICMTLTGKTLDENLKIVRKYEKQIDLVELRVDHLNEEDQFLVKRFPAMVRQPCILSIRRDVDGGLFTSGEFSRTNLFAKALAFANSHNNRKFSYVDFEDDYYVSSIQDAAQAFGVRIIRSIHNLKEPITNIKEQCEKMLKTGNEIPKITFKPNSIKDLINLYNDGSQMTQFDHILSAVGVEGLPSRILASYSNSFLTYVSAPEMIQNVIELGHIDPITMNNVYRFKLINSETALFGIAGWPLENPLTIEIQNKRFINKNLNAVYLPLRSSLMTDILTFSEKLNFKGLSVEPPFSESVMYYLDEQTPELIQIGSCNTVLRQNNKWIGYNTVCTGFKSALEDFLGPIRIKRKKVAVIGSGAIAKAVVYVLKQLGAKVCIFNRTEEHAEQIAGKYGFEYCLLDENCAPKLDEYSTLIIQTSSVGGEGEINSSPSNDPIYFYNFRGNELLLDLIYTQEITPVMRRASLAGCHTSNGKRLLEYQSLEQFKLFMGQIKNQL